MKTVVLIPENYERLSFVERNQVVPICITALDRYGRPIPMEWFSKGVAPVRPQLVNIASRVLGDPWRVSELAEMAIHRLWERHGTVVTPSPARLVLKKAMWLAQELKNGGWRQMKYRNLNVPIDALDERCLDKTLVDPKKYAEQFNRQILLDWFADHLETEGRTEILMVYSLLRRGHTWQEIAEHIGVVDVDCVKRRFYRGIKKAAEILAC